MADVHNLDELDAQEVADILQVSKNTVYRLAKEKLLPSYNVGRKLRFSMSDVETYIETSKTGGTPRTAPTPERPQSAGAQRSGFILAGHDIMLDILANYLSQTGLKALRSYHNSYDALFSLYKDEADVAAIHLWDSSTNSYNLPYIKRLCPGTPLMVYHLATTMQGLLVQPGNPKNLSRWSDLATEHITLANRERGCGSRVLLDEKLRLLEAAPHAIKGYDREITSALAQASLISRKGADVGIGDERTFQQFKELDFLPLEQEEIALVVKKSPRTVPLQKAIKSLLKSTIYQQEVKTLLPYNIRGMGNALYEV